MGMEQHASNLEQELQTLSEASQSTQSEINRLLNEKNTLEDK